MISFQRGKSIRIDALFFSCRWPFTGVGTFILEPPPAITFMFPVRNCHAALVRRDNWPDERRHSIVPGVTWPLDTVKAFKHDKAAGPWLPKIKTVVARRFKSCRWIRRGDANWKKAPRHSLMKSAHYSLHDAAAVRWVHSSWCDLTPCRHIIISEMDRRADAEYPDSVKGLTFP